MTKQALIWGFVLGLGALPWAGCGGASDESCSGARCATGASATGGSAAAGNGLGGSATGGSATGGSAMARGGTPSSMPGCANDDCAGAPTEAGAGGAPTTQICVPQAASCDGANVVVCNASGTARSVTKTCALNQVCGDGACRDIVCAPSTKYCFGQDIWSCGSDGTSASLVKHCNNQQFCHEEQGNADCSATKCVAGAAMCVGDLATQCQSDGSGPAPGGDDCSAHAQACYEGECRDLACTPGHKLCDHDDVYLCTENGTSTSLFSACNNDTEYCDPTSASCRTRVCVPGTLGCDGTRVATCDSLGSRYVSSDVDCDQQGKVCVSGSCKSLVCTANAYVCSQGDIYKCNATGTASSLYQNCTSNNSHCYLSGTYAYCAYNPCTANTRQCSGTSIMTCNSDGSAWLSTTTDCAAMGKACQDGACVPQVCTPNAVTCSGAEVRQCSYDGLTWYVGATCGAGTTCVEQDGGALCVQKPCKANEVACISEQLGTCAADGMSLASVASNCGAQTKVCTTAGCADSATDTLGASSQVTTPSEPVLGNEIRVQTARTLTQIEAYLSLPGSRALTWLIYEDLGNSQFSLVFSSASTASGTGFQSSGNISYALRAGKSYFVGVNVTGSFVAYFASPVDPQTLSFGTTLGSAVNYDTATTMYTYVQPDLLYYFRLTTTH